ncbi:MAG: hypothetical protein QOH26_1654 [Actinomycetota bacterium]|nr:hypothetical protein [Actinomycetota bacterium]
MDAGAAAARSAGTRRFVVWSPEGLPPRVGHSLERVDGVRDAVKARFALDWLLEARAPGGSRVQSPPSGAGYPFEVLLVAPRAYAKFAPTEDREAIRRLDEGEVLIPKMEARLRATGNGSRFQLRSGTVRVSGVVSNAATQGYEALMARPAPSDWTYQMRYFLVEASTDVSIKSMRRAVKRVTSDDIRFRIRSENKTRFLRYATSVRPQVVFKRTFGEFAARPTKTGALTLMDGWRDNNIRTESVPILGSVTCHRKLFPQMRGALNELEEKGLAYLIRRDEYAGCYNSRFVATPPGIRLSRHAWGVAFDINTSNNQFGQEPHQDPRLVRIMRKWGLLWGGTWPLPDGMHFEWTRFPN